MVPRRGDWMVRLEDTLLGCAQPAVLVAHSLGCHLVAAWAQHSQQRHRVAAALLVAPPDLARLDLPPQIHNWAPVVAQALSFPSTTVLSADDPFCSAQRGQQIAAAWSSQVHSLGSAGHINGECGLGDWPTGYALLQALMQRAGVAAR